MILILDRGASVSIQIKQLADEVWERSDIDGNYTLIKQRHNNHTQWNPGKVIDETMMELHLHGKAANTFPNPKQVWQYPLTPGEAFKPIKGIKKEDIVTLMKLTFEYATLRGKNNKFWDKEITQLYEYWKDGLK